MQQLIAEFNQSIIQYSTQITTAASVNTEQEGTIIEQLQESIEVQYPIIDPITGVRTGLPAEQSTEIVNSSVEGDIVLQSYNKTGDGQSITAGNYAIVGLYLDTPKAQINITVYPSSNPGNIVASHTYNNSPANSSLAYIWQTYTSTTPGTYTIRWNYPDAPGWDDYFTVNVTAPPITPPSTPDTYESNNTTGTATTASLGSSYYSYISYNGDIDYYRVNTGATSGTLSINLDVPNGLDYDVYVYDVSNNVVATGTSGAGTDESLNFSVNANSIYYVKVYGYGGAYGQAYNLMIGNLVPSVQSIYENSPLDVSLTTGQYRVYRFTPTQTGNYSLFTGPYGGYGAANDTYLELYSDANLTTQTTQPNDDSNGTLFSTINVTLNAGVSYYIKLRPYNMTAGAVYARLSVMRQVPVAQQLYLNSPVDNQILQGEYKVFKFTPSTNGKYSFFTSPYAGAGSIMDTYLHLYSNASLTSQLHADDDSGDGTFSDLQYELLAGVTYYIKLRGYNDQAVNARLTVRPVYTYKNLFIQAETDSSPQFAAQAARNYNGLIYVNLLPEETTLNELRSNGFVIEENGYYWIYLHELSNYMDVWDEENRVVVQSETVPDIITQENVEYTTVEYVYDDVSTSDVSASVSACGGFTFIPCVTYVVITIGYEVKDGKLNVTMKGKASFGSTAFPTSWTPSVEYKSSPTNLNPSWQTEELDGGLPIPWGQAFNASMTITESNWYMLELEAKIKSKAGTKKWERDRGNFLLNKVGKLYPYYVDPNSGLSMHFPTRTDWPEFDNPNGCGLTNTERTSYRTWYDNKFGAIQWTHKDPNGATIVDYEIHHIRPCEYGGDNSYTDSNYISPSTGWPDNNLIPLPTGYHRGTVSPWWVNY